MEIQTHRSAALRKILESPVISREREPVRSSLRTASCHVGVRTLVDGSCAVLSVDT
jgi:hypothetical protein